MPQAHSRRCSICAEHYPNTDQYKICPNCGEPTWKSSKGLDGEDWDDSVSNPDSNVMERDEAPVSSDGDVDEVEYQTHLLQLRRDMDAWTFLKDPSSLLPFNYEDEPPGPVD